MKQQIISQIRKQTKTFGRNVTLERAEKKKEFYAFRKFLNESFIKQFNHIANNLKVVEDLMFFYKEVNQNAKIYLRNEWFDLYDMVEDEFEQYYGWSGTIGGQSALDKMGFRAKPFYLSNPEVLQYFKNRENLVITNINDTNKDILLNIFQQSRALHLTPYEVSQLIKEQIPDISQNRADLISRNELAHSVGTVEFETFKRNNVKNIRWVTAMDDRVCPECEPLHNHEVTINGRFASDNYNVNRPPLHVNCFVHHSVKINTDTGLKDISKIKEGDRVLTHTGKYQTVTSTLKNNKRYYGEVIKIRYKGKVMGTSNTRNSITITPEHPILTQRGWIMAKDLILNDRLYVIAKRCLTCNKQMPYWLDKYCSRKCNTNAIAKLRKLGLSNIGINNNMFGKTKEKHHNWKGGKIWWRGKEWDNLKKDIIKRDNNKCQSCGMTQEEHLVKYKQPLQVHHINPYRYSKNNDEENLITLCCSCHIKIEGTNNKHILDSGGVEYMSIHILEIQKINKFEGERLYNFAVENDESYIADGIVVHNCRCYIEEVFDEITVRDNKYVWTGN
jgi:5-methylcytosine-specific restriction endonuclease McrA